MLNAVDVNQTDMHGTIGFGVADDQMRFQQNDVFGMPYFMALAVRQPNQKRFERPLVEKLTYRLSGHLPLLLTVFFRFSLDRPRDLCIPLTSIGIGPFSIRALHD